MPLLLLLPRAHEQGLCRWFLLAPSIGKGGLSTPECTVYSATPRGRRLKGGVDQMDPLAAHRQDVVL
jgi:hypothetical protein